MGIFLLWSKFAFDGLVPKEKKPLALGWGSGPGGAEWWRQPLAGQIPGRDAVRVSPSLAVKGQMDGGEA